MSMTTFKLLEFFSIFATYTLVTLALPAVVLRKFLKGRSIAEQFLMSLVAGNFYVINIVFFVQLLHISNRWTLLLLTIVPPTIIWGHIQQVSLKRKWLDFWTQLRRFMQGKLGAHTARYYVGRWMEEKVRALFNATLKAMLERPLQCAFVVFLFGALWWVYGRKLIISYGYAASDIPVHMEWINQMSRDNLFSSGVYPFGFHCVAYYLHTVFGIDVYVIMCQFFFLQVIYAHLALLACLKGQCKSKYLPYAGTIFYALANVWADHTYDRFYSTLPQEFGMIFIMPSIYFLIRIFQTEKEELKKKETKMLLVCFAMAFSLTLAIHFYGTMVAGVCCVGIGFGFFVRFIRKEYFTRIMLSGTIGVFCAVLPMAIAFATGTPLQGSLGWGLSVIQQKSNQSSQVSNTTISVKQTLSEEEEQQAMKEKTTNDTASNSEQQTSDEVENSTTVQSTRKEGTAQEGTTSAVQENTSAKGTTEESMSNQSDTTQDEEVQTDTTQDNSTVSNEIINQVNDGLATEEQSSVSKVDFKNVASQIEEYVVSTNYKGMGIGYIALSCIGALFPIGIFFLFLKRYSQGEMFLATGFYMLFMIIVLSANQFGIPALMNPDRCSIYCAYLMAIPFMLCIDTVIRAVTIPFDFILKCTPKVKRVGRYISIKNIVSLVVAAAIVIGIFELNMLKSVSPGSNFVTNSAIICIDNIIHENKDETWTIVSANDELQMGLDHGWHYESIEFLREMEYLDNDTMVTIPTPVVYFFIEKIPVPYIGGSYVEKTISEKGASQALPGDQGISVYRTDNRWVIMSRMYYWAQAFKKKYPNELKVYYESGNFICYKLEQNTYHLYNLAIDYGYNTVADEETENN